jgi:hypothetical protein
MTQATDLDSVLAAESLLLTLIAFVYGLLYPQLAAAAGIKLGERQVADLDVAEDRKKIELARWRAWLFAGVATVVGAVFAPVSVHATWHFLARLPNGFDAFRHYNTVATTLVLVTLGCFFLAIHASAMAVGLTATLRKLTAPRQ